LFNGPYGTPKKEAAILLAQSIMCENNDHGLACEECNTCQRIAHNTYADLIILDGHEESISKEMVDEVQSRFSKTALEKNGRKVYIILNCENATISAQNSMLKFLEEPTEGVTAILTCDNINRLLPTIVSRCTTIPFMPISSNYYVSKAIEYGFNESDAYFVSKIAKTDSDLSLLYEDGKVTDLYNNILGMFKDFVSGKKKDVLIDYQVSYKISDSDKKKSKTENMFLLSSFFTLVISYCHDVINHNLVSYDWYQRAISKEKMDKDHLIDLIVTMSDSRDKINRSNDLDLLMDQTFYKLEG